MNILNEIIENKKKEVEQRKDKISIEDIERSLEDIYDLPQRSFLEAIRKIDNINIIAEIKKASPSKGVINQDVDIVEIAKIYENSGVSAISVLTDYKYFKGSLDYLTEVSQAVNIPCLCKDFIIDPYQVYEAKLYLADAFLIIAKALDAEKIRALVDIGRDLRLDALVEVHDLEDIKKLENLDIDIIGVNNRSLEDLSIDINTSLNLKEFLPEGKVYVSESGICTKEDVYKMSDAGFDAVLVGTSIMQSGDVEGKLKELSN